jgi:hypothetical protein
VLDLLEPCLRQPVAKLGPRSCGSIVVTGFPANKRLTELSAVTLTRLVKDLSMWMAERRWHGGKQTYLESAELGEWSEMGF